MVGDLGAEGAGMLLGKSFRHARSPYARIEEFRVSCRRSGFTLIELLIVVVILGILAAVAIPNYNKMKERAFVTRMISDLRNLIQSEEIYFNEHGIYYGGGLPAAGMAYDPSENVTVTITEASVGGWSATATSPVYPRTCAVFLGTAASVTPATVNGTVACDK